jgi:hypothetical protein
VDRFLRYVAGSLTVAALAAAVVAVVNDVTSGVAGAALFLLGVGAPRRRRLRRPAVSQADLPVIALVHAWLAVAVAVAVTRHGGNDLVARIKLR